MGSALEDLANSPDPQPQSGGSALEALANGPDTPPPTDVAHQLVSLSGLKQTLSTKEGWQAAADPLTGFVKGAGDTVHGVGELLRKVGNYGSRNSANPGEGDRVIPPVGQKALDIMSTDEPGNYAQHTGKALEAVAEFMTGEGAVDEAGKVLSVGDKLKTLGSVGKFIESHPVVAKLLARAGKDAIVGGGQTTAKTGSPTEGAEGAGIGAGAGLVLGGLGQGAKYVRDLYKPLAQSTALAEVQPLLQKGIRETVSGVAQDSGVGNVADAAKADNGHVAAAKAALGADASPSQILQKAQELKDTTANGKSIRDAVSEVAEKVKGKSQPVFQKLDELSGGKLSDAQARASKYAGALDKAGKDAHELAIKDQNALFEKFKSQFEPNAFDQAKADWKQYRALQEVDATVKNSTVGQRPEVAKAVASKQPVETVNPKMLMTRLNKLYNDGTLQTAMGPDKAHDLLQHAGAAQMQADHITANIKTANAKQLMKRRIVSGTAGLGLVGGADAAARYAASHTVKHALSGQ